MTISREEMIVLKMNLLGGMNAYIIESGDESVWESWIMGGVPDGATEQDLLEIAKDEESWVDCCTLFGKLVKRLD